MRNERDISFSECDGAWVPIPAWARFLLDLGHRWPRTDSGRNRVYLISMPCDSAGAGLVALGALVRDLGDARANDADSHYDNLKRYANDYLAACGRRDAPGQVCETSCNPAKVRCGRDERSTGLLRDVGGDRYRVIEVRNPTPEFPLGSLFCRQPNTQRARRKEADVRTRGKASSAVSRWLLPPAAKEWTIDGDVAIELPLCEFAIPTELYDGLVSGAEVEGRNLRSSYSGLCLAGRAAGEAATRAVLESVRFRSDEKMQYGLPRLLTLRGERDMENLSRLVFFNPRTERMDRVGAQPSLVVADGIDSFRLALKRFPRADVIGVAHRIEPRERLETLGESVQALMQWYEPDVGLAETLDTPPRGMNVLALKRRAV